MQRLGRVQVVAAVRRDALTADQVKPRAADVAGVEVGEAAIEQCDSQVRRVRLIGCQQADRVVERLQRFGSPPGAHQQMASLALQESSVLGRG